MSLSRRCLVPTGSAPIRRCSIRVAVAACAGALLVACAPPGEQGEAAEEDLAATAPAQEQTADVEGGVAAQQDDAVAVDLPGLPIGGDDVEFTSAAPGECVRVNWTAGSLLDGVSVELREFDAGAGFTVSSQPCTPTPCLGGPRLTTSNPGCEVWVVRDGGFLEAAAADLVVTQARLVCETEALCRDTLTAIAAEGPATIGLLVAADEQVEQGTGESPAEGLTNEQDTGEPTTEGETDEQDTGETPMEGGTVASGEETG